jgi:hypothetical protein
MSRGRRIHVQRPVGPMTVIVREVISQDGLEMASSEDEHAIKALTPQRADKPLGERVCSRRLDRSADDS